MQQTNTSTQDQGLARVAARRPIERVILPRIDRAMLEELPDSEHQFYLDARQQVRRLEEDRKEAAARRVRDDLAIESLADAMVDLGDFDPAAFPDLQIADIAAAAEVKVRHAARLRRDAYWLARDNVETHRLRGLNQRTPAEEIELARRNSESTYERDLRIATDALTSGLVKTKHLKPADRPYSPRHATIVREYCRREEYLRRMADELRAQSHVVTSHDAEGVVITRHQSASDRFDEHGRGYVGEAGWVGGSSTQENGGTCWQGNFAEKGKRSGTSVMTQRYLAATPKAAGKRRKGITKKDVVQRIQYLDGIGKTPKEIAVDIGESVIVDIGESVSRVKGALHALQNDTRHWSGDNNDRRHVHLKKWAALDQIHGNTRTDCREIIRGDKDQVFESVQEFFDYLNSLLVPPQQYTYVWDDRYPERVTRPHLLWWLPADKGVWYDEPTGMAMFEGVAAALTIMAGCDIGGLANVGDVKQPTSPRVVARDWQTEKLLDLSELCKILNVDLKQNLVVTMRSQSVSESQSGAFYTMGGKRGFELCLLWEGTGELRVDAQLDRRVLGEQIAERLLQDRIMLDELSKLRASARDAAENSIRVAAKKVAESYGKGRRASSRGYDLRAAEAETKKAVADVRQNASADLTEAEIKKLEIHAAQNAGQVYCNRVQVQRSVRRIADAMLEISKSAVPDNKGVCELIGMDPRTIRKHWDAAVALNGANAIVAHIMDAPTTVPEPENQADATPAAPPAKCSGVWGVTTYGSPQAQPGQPSEPTPATSAETPSLRNTIPATMLPLVNALRPWSPASGYSQIGRALLEFCRPGVTLYRSQDGIREQERRRRKGLPPSGKSGSLAHLEDADVWPEAMTA
jgi:hypothetical protein